QQSMEHARNLGLDMRLRLLVGDDETREKIDAAIASGLDWIEVSHIEKTGTRVIQDVMAWEPNILHFFCHGIVDASEQSLELATGGDYADPEATSGSVRIHTKQLFDMGQKLPNTWLLTLNCCSSGQAAEDLQSMTHQAVSGGFPAAVAMLEPVDAADAYEFTRAFYSELFEEVWEV